MIFRRVTTTTHRRRPVLPPPLLSFSLLPALSSLFASSTFSLSFTSRHSVFLSSFSSSSSSSSSYSTPSLPFLPFLPAADKRRIVGGIFDRGNKRDGTPTSWSREEVIRMHSLDGAGIVTNNQWRKMLICRLFFGRARWSRIMIIFININNRSAKHVNEVSFAKACLFIRTLIFPYMNFYSDNCF